MIVGRSERPARRAPSVGLVGVMLAVALLVSGCTVWVKTGDDAVHLTFVNAMRQVSTEVGGSLKALHPACDVGGTKQACHDVSVQLASQLRTEAQKVQSAPAPPADQATKDAIIKALDDQAAALGVRAASIAENSDAKWQQASTDLNEATTRLIAALNTLK